MARSIWSGSISFGLVNIPVSLTSAVEPKEVHFHLLHDADGARIAEHRVCTADGKEVPWAHIIKGYEYAKGKTVQVTTDELDRFAPELTKTVDIEQFVEAAEIDPVYYQRTYYVEATGSGAKAYQLLAGSMDAAGKVAIGRVVLRQKQHLCAIRSRDGQLMLSTMFFPDEIRAHAGHKASGKVAPKERALAEQLIGNLTGPWKPSAFRDDYREKLLHFLASKAKRKGKAEPETEVEESSEETASQSLFDTLSASLQHQATRARSRRSSATAKRAPRETKTTRRAKVQA